MAYKRQVWVREDTRERLNRKKLDLKCKDVDEVINRLLGSDTPDFSTLSRRKNNVFPKI